jgi:HEAT repeat protein
MPNSRIRAAIGAVVVLLATAGAGADVFEPIDDEEAKDAIAWHDDLAKAFAKAADEKKVVMICVNARETADGKEEPAAKGLRDVVYRHPKVVEKSRAFVCVLLTAEASSADHGELRARFGLSGRIVSPQHIFAAPGHREGAAPLVRKRYWPYGKGDTAVDALLALMDKALAAHGVEQGGPPPKAEPAPARPTVDGPPPVPAGDPRAAGARAAWALQTLVLARSAKRETRRAALRALVKHDRDGDLLKPVLALVVDFDEAKQYGKLVDVVHVLGVPGLARALPALHDMLKHKDDDVRAEAAVSLEYVGSKESPSVLAKRVNREKNEAIANHMYRALGRCGAGEAKVKRSLLKRIRPGRSRFAAYGPIIGLAYFEGDAKLARTLEKELLKWGQPFGGGKGSRSGTFMRALLIWCLSEIADPKTAPFLRERYLAPLEHVESRWKDEVHAYYDAAAKRCAGDESEAVRAAITRGIRRYVGWDRFARDLRDDARRDRDRNAWEPKGEWEPLEDE